MSHKLPNMTATEIANAKHPPAPGDSLISALIDREISAMVEAGLIDQKDVDALTSSSQPLR